MLKSKKGNVIIVVAAIFAILAFALGSFLKTTIDRRHSAQKLGETMYAREFAKSLAVLTIDYIKEQLRNPNGDKSLKEAFSFPWDYSGNETKGEIKFSSVDVIDSSTGKSLIGTLQQELNLKDFALVDNKINWNLSDLKPIKVGNEKDGTIPYPREKTGLININFKVKYKIPGKNENISEEYNYASDIKVVANLLPVLSKFTFYVENAFDNEEANQTNSCRFNVIDTNVGGELNDTGKPVRPWVFNNVGENETVDNGSEKPKSYSELVQDKRGFIYIGGGTKDYPIRLGIACGDVDLDIGNLSEYGEDFHFFKKPESEGGFFKTLEPPTWNDNEGILCANLGLCNDFDPDSGYKDYLDLLGESNYDLAKYNSIFKLYGTDQMFSRGIFSPTLVLGFVDSMYASIRIFKTSEDENDFFKLNYYEDSDGFSAALDEDSDECDYDLTEFRTAYEIKFLELLEYDTYRSAFSSRIESVPYNNDYTFTFKRDESYPFHNILKDEELEKLCDRKSNDEVFVKIPNTEKAQYGNIYKDIKDLTILNYFIDPEKLSIVPEGNRIAHTLKLVPAGKEKTRGSIVLEKNDKVSNVIINYLKTKNLLLDEGLDLNGWLYIDSDELNEDFELPLKFGNKKILSQGGIILSKGKICIDENILNDPTNHLTLLTLGNDDTKGDITIKSNVTEVNASLISKNGHVYLEDDNNRKISLDIYGNIIMRNIGFNSKKSIIEKAGLRRGLRLNYRPELSAIPDFNRKNEIEKSRSEYKLLMFNIKDNPKSL